MAPLVSWRGTRVNPGGWPEGLDGGAKGGSCLGTTLRWLDELPEPCCLLVVGGHEGAMTERGNLREGDEADLLRPCDGGRRRHDARRWVVLLVFRGWQGRGGLGRDLHAGCALGGLCAVGDVLEKSLDFAMGDRVGREIADPLAVIEGIGKGRAHADGGGDGLSELFVERELLRDGGPPIQPVGNDQALGLVLPRTSRDFWIRSMKLLVDGNRYRSD